MDRLIELLPELWDATLETLYVASGALILGGLGGLVLGIALYATRAGSLFPNRVVFGTLNVIVNTFRPIPALARSCKRCLRATATRLSLRSDRKSVV